MLIQDSISKRASYLFNILIKVGLTYLAQHSNSNEDYGNVIQVVSYQWKRIPYTMRYV